MWFFFGFITLISCTLVIGYKRFKAAWKGEEHSIGNQKYLQAVRKGKAAVGDLLVGVDAPQGFDFKFKAESSVDRFFKFAGLSREYQVGDPDFDDLVYVVSDDQYLHALLKNGSGISNAILALFKKAQLLRYNVKDIQCRHSRLWVTLKPQFMFDFDLHSNGVGGEFAPILFEITNVLARQSVNNKLSWRDPFVVRAAVLLSISSGLAVNAGMHLYRVMLFETPMTLDLTELLWDSFLLGVLVVAVLVLAALKLLGRSARTHLVLVELLLVGLLGAVSTSFLELRDANIELDQSIEDDFAVVVQDKVESKSRRSTKYYFYVDDWLGGSEPRKIGVNYGLFHDVKIGEVLMVGQKEGRLGFRWISSLSKSPANQNSHIRPD